MSGGKRGKRVRRSCRKTQDSQHPLSKLRRGQEKRALNQFKVTSRADGHIQGWQPGGGLGAGKADAQESAAECPLNPDQGGRSQVTSSLSLTLQQAGGVQADPPHQPEDRGERTPSLGTPSIRCCCKTKYALLRIPRYHLRAREAEGEELRDQASLSK